MPIRSRIPDEWRPVMAAFHEELASWLWRGWFVVCASGLVYFGVSGELEMSISKVKAHQWGTDRWCTIQIAANSDAFPNSDEQIVNFSDCYVVTCTRCEILQRNSSAILRPPSAIFHNSSAILKSMSFRFSKTFRNWFAHHFPFLGVRSSCGKLHCIGHRS